MALLSASGAAPGGDGRWAGWSDTVFEHVTAEHGPPNFSTALAQDREGFLWVGAFGGLARWDGYRLRTYTPDAARAGALPDAIIQALLAAQDGKLWIGTNAHGLLRFDPRTEQFQQVAAGPGGIGHLSILALAAAPDGRIWVGSDVGVDLLGRDDKVTVRLRAAPDGLPEAHARALAVAADGSLWIGTSIGLARRDARSGAVMRVALTAGAQPEVDSLYVATDGRVWVGTRGRGAFVVDPRSLAAQPVNDAGAGALPTESVYAVAEARPGEIWLGTFGKGIVAVDAASGRARRMRHDPALPTTLANDSVWALLRDRSGLVWAATAQGLSRTDPGQQAVLTLFGDNDGAPHRLPDTDVISVFEDARQRLWLGFGSHGVALLDKDGKLSASLAADAARPETALPADRVTALVPHGGAVYIGTVRGVYRADPDAQRVARVALPGADPALRVNALLSVADTLWIGARDLGLWRWTGDAARHVDGLTDERITALDARDGTLWAGTRNGLNRIDLRSGAIERIPADPRNPAGLSAAYVNAVLVDRKSRLWVGTFGGGVALLEGRGADGKPRFRRIGEAQGLPSPNIVKLLEDRRGNVWASTDNGYAKIDAATFAVRTLRRGDGPGIGSGWSGSGTTTADGEIVFGGLGGLTVIRPERLQAWPWKPPVVLSELAIGGKPVPASAPLVLTPQANSLRAEVAALDFSAPARNRYAWRLEPFDDAWTEADASRRQIAYAKLPPGDYVLHLRGSNRDGVWSDAQQAFPLRVLPAWYQMLWFRLLCAALLVGALAGLIRLRLAALRTRQRDLEREVAARTADLREQKRALLDANKQLEISADTLRRLGEIGRDITAHLDAAAVFQALDRHVGRLFGSTLVQVYRANGGGSLELAHGALLPAADSVQAARAAQERTVVVDGASGTDIVYAPLVAGERLLGVLVVAATDGYGERERLIVGTLCAYVAIALVNAEARIRLVQQEKLASLSTLVAGMAHEVNTPLGVIVSSISGATEVLRALSEAAKSGKVTRTMLEANVAHALEFAALAMRNADRVAQLVHSFKSIVATGDDEPPQQIDLASYLPQMSALLRQELAEAGHALRIHVAPGLKARVVVGALTEVLTRILHNVRDHAFPPGVRGEVQLRAGRDAHGQVVLTVHDNGRGIPAKDLPRVFDPFFTTRAGAGGHAGLGLNVAFNHATERLGGTLRIDSGAQGTTVTLRFPA
ncbi:MAG TPA: two-component regulator propeller domain-containing protein [Telluria sp.]|nr:two-component regulator propeller domain-containing protein [Telluria sp.]